MEAVPRPKVLYVDDNRDLADSAADLLRIVGFDVRVCYDGPSALAVAREFAPDVCLLDLNMPGMEGDELASHIREEAGGRPVLFIAVTAMGSEESRARTAATGFSLHLVKPVDPHDLLRIVDELWQVFHAASQARTPQDVRPNSGEESGG
jgi:CheY-like chemotaxis protein